MSSTSNKLAKQISIAIQKIDDSMDYKDLALAVAQILKDDYGAHNFKPFLTYLSQHLKENKMKKSELRQLIREELQKLNEKQSFDGWKDSVKAELKRTGYSDAKIAQKFKSEAEFLKKSYDQNQHCVKVAQQLK